MNGRYEVNQVRTPQEFSQDLKQNARESRRKADKMGRVYLEVDHIVPRHLGGSSESSNAKALTKSEHAGKHIFGALYPEPEQNPAAEWLGARQVIARMDIDEFVDFVDQYGEAITGTKERFTESSALIRWRKRAGL